MRSEHGDQALAEAVIADMRDGAQPEAIGRKYGLSSSKLEELVTRVLGVNVSSLSAKPIRSWGPKDFSLETSTVWSFKSRGNWATHSGRYRGNWSPYIPRNVILRYSQPAELVLDAFVGSGTTAVEAKLLGRKCVCLDINPGAVALTQHNLDFELPGEGDQEAPVWEPDLRLGDARDLSFLDDESVDLVCTHPPYAGIIDYSAEIPGDLSQVSDEDYLQGMEAVARELHRVLKPGRQCAVLLGDTRRRKRVVPLGLRTIERFLRVGLRLRELVIKRQHNCRTTGFWYERSIRYGFLLLAHEFLPIFEKPIEAALPRPPAAPQVDFGASVVTDRTRTPETMETTTVWLLADEDAVRANLKARFAPEGTMTELCPAAARRQRVSDGEFLFVRFPGVADWRSAKGWQAGLRQAMSGVEAQCLAIEAQDVRKPDGTVEPTALTVLEAMAGEERWSLREFVVIAPPETAPEEQQDGLAIVHRYLLVWDVADDG